MTTSIRTCKNCGPNVSFRLNSQGNWICRACESKSVMASRRRNKDRARIIKGSKCERCGYDKCPSALHFHHVDPSQKSLQITDSAPWEKINNELTKCILLCANCHIEVHHEMREAKSNKLEPVDKS